MRDAIRAIYSPGSLIPSDDVTDSRIDPICDAEWQRIDFDTVRFYRHGTTSFILSGLPTGAIQGDRRPLALKCIVYPFLQVPTIVRATREYLSRYGVPGRDVRHLVRVWASSSSWILMDFVAGPTLAEYLESIFRNAARNGRRSDVHASKRRRSAASGYKIRADLLAELGGQLFSAVADLERANLTHDDLSPANIIVQQRDDEGVWFILIDLGVNYLYAHAMPGLEGPDSAFVAPEIREGNGGTARADLYSIGQLLVAIAGGFDSLDGSVPDRFYAETPVMARFIEDLIDDHPNNRMIIFQPDPTRPLYPQLRETFSEELTAMAIAQGEHRYAVLPKPLAGLFDLFKPLAGAPGRQWRMWQLRRTQQLYRQPRRGMHVRWLLFWSWLSAAAWYVAVTILATWWLRDLGWDWGNQIVALLQRATGSTQEQFPLLDEIRQANYPIPDPIDNLPVRLAGISFLLVGARYYQNIFAGLTPLTTGMHQGRLTVLALLTEIQMRLFAIMAFVLVLPPTLVQRRWWPIFTAIGITFTFLGNWTCLSFARSALRRATAQNLSTVPTRPIAGLESFSDWAPSSGFYAASTWSLGLGIYFGIVHDVFIYAGAVASINIVLFYMIKCGGRNAADVRIGLGRAFLAAERLRYLTTPQTNTRRPAHHENPTTFIPRQHAESGGQQVIHQTPVQD